MTRPRQHADGYGYSPERAGVTSVTRSAEVVVPMVVRVFRPQRVLDVGCGTGDWLSEFRRHGAAHIAGFDGDWVPRSGLKMPAEAFHAVSFDGPLPPCERFDLALCLEVAEHVEQEVALKLVDYLCASADVVLWSAAIPGQGGYGHINERYQGFWVDQFGTRGFEAFDLIRPHVWMDERVSWWYRQNLLVFASAQGRRLHSLTAHPFVASLVHPYLYDRARNPRNYSLRQILNSIPYYCLDRLRRLVS
jgi:SAM-dependent methyltransferase